jgi:hypothetical protein
MILISGSSGGHAAGKLYLLGGDSGFDFEDPKIAPRAVVIHAQSGITNEKRATNHRIGGAIEYRVRGAPLSPDALRSEFPQCIVAGPKKELDTIIAKIRQNLFM